MKTLKLILTVFVIGIFAAFALPAMAQQAGSYTLTSTNPIAASITNPAVILPVSEFDNAGLTLKTTPTTTNSGSVYVFVKKSGDGSNFESVPSYTITASEVTAGATIQFTNLDLRGASHISVTIGNTGSATVTNTVLLNLKSPKFGAKTATR